MGLTFAAIILEENLPNFVWMIQQADEIVQLRKNGFTENEIRDEMKIRWEKLTYFEKVSFENRQIVLSSKDWNRFLAKQIRRLKKFDHKEREQLANPDIRKKSNLDEHVHQLTRLIDNVDLFEIRAFSELLAQEDVSELIERQANGEIISLEIYTGVNDYLEKRLRPQPVKFE